MGISYIVDPISSTAITYGDPLGVVLLHEGTPVLVEMDAGTYDDYGSVENYTGEDKHVRIQLLVKANILPKGWLQKTYKELIERPRNCGIPDTLEYLYFRTDVFQDFVNALVQLDGEERTGPGCMSREDLTKLSIEADELRVRELEALHLNYTVKPSLKMRLDRIHTNSRGRLLGNFMSEILTIYKPLRIKDLRKEELIEAYCTWRTIQYVQGVFFSARAEMRRNTYAGQDSYHKYTRAKIVVMERVMRERYEKFIQQGCYPNMTYEEYVATY